MIRLMRRRIANLLLWLIGWKPEGSAPAQAKCIVIAAPHTSNWDFVLMLLFSYHFGVRMQWMGKHSLFHGPMGWLMRRLGGIAIDRRSQNNVVQQMAEEFNRASSLCVVIPPEGTRGYTSYWKSGFYHIAAAAGVPIVLGHLDYQRKVGGLGVAVWPSGDVQGDMDRIRNYYSQCAGRFPHLFGPVRLRDEEGMVEEPAA